MNDDSELEMAAIATASKEAAFMDQHGTKWLVSEATLHEGTAPGSAASSSNRHSRRRVVTFPDNYRELEPWAGQRPS